MLSKTDLLRLATEFTEQSSSNVVGPEIALVPEAAGMRIYDTPLMGCAAASDPLFTELKRPEVVGPHHESPGYWLPGAKSVIAFFFPFTRRVTKANSAGWNWPALEWLHARIEGQAMMLECIALVKERIEAEGGAAVIPIRDTRFTSRGWSWSGPVKDYDMPLYSSNWSERHVAHVAGLGTFGLSRGLITAKGVAGRFISLVTDMALAPDPRPYGGHNEYCTRCGACIPHCPPGAISLERGKDHHLCAPFLEDTLEKHKPRYGCGKCQVAVPCGHGIPPKRKSGAA